MSKGDVVGEWQRSRGSLGAAQSCLRDGYYADTVSRAYYAVFHAAKAVLLLRNIRIRNHRGLRDVFSQHIVRVGLIEPEWGREIGRLSDLRGVADYDVTRNFAEGDAIRTYERADGFCNRIRELLAGAIPAGQL